MATYRPVYINIWKDPTFEGYKPPMKLIFIYLITNESTTESGIYPITIKTISNETSIPVKTVGQLLSNGLKNVAYDFENNFIFIKNFLKYSSGGGRPDLLQKSIEKNYKNFNTPLWNEFKIIYPQYSQEIQTVDKPLANRCCDVASISNAISISNAKDKDISKDNNTSPKNPKEFSDDSQEIILSKLLFEKILERNPECKKPDFQKWALNIDLMVRKDKRNFATIKKVIKWCQDDDFWQNNILSTGKLRDQYDQLILKMDKKKNNEPKSWGALRKAASNLESNSISSISDIFGSEANNDI